MFAKLLNSLRRGSGETLTVLERGLAILLALGIHAGCGSGDDNASVPGPSDAGGADAVEAAADGSLPPADASTAEDATEEGAFGIEASSDAEVLTCPIQQTTYQPASTAQSAGFSGTMTAYDALYGGPCAIASDCAPGCVAAGGTMTSCASSSECLTGEAVDGGLGCLPPTYWFDVSEAESQSNTTTDAAVLILVDQSYDDALVLTGFGVSIPSDATITGIQFQVQRNADDSFAVDDSVRIMKNGVLVGTDHALGGAWPSALTDQTYGGAYDAWGVSWAPEDVESGGFGLSIAPQYNGPSAGNDRAHIDSVLVRVFYTTPCE